VFYQNEVVSVFLLLCACVRTKTSAKVNCERFNQTNEHNCNRDYSTDDKITNLKGQTMHEYFVRNGKHFKLTMKLSRICLRIVRKSYLLIWKKRQ